MKQGYIVRAGNVLNVYANDRSVPRDIHYIFYRVRLLIRDQYEFQIEQEKLINEKYPNRIENGKRIFDRQEDEAAFEQEMFELSDMEIPLGEYKKIPMKIDERCPLTAAEMEALEDFIDYQE